MARPKLKEDDETLIKTVRVTRTEFDESVSAGEEFSAVVREGLNFRNRLRKLPHHTQTVIKTQIEKAS